jgi:hypothetical protein
VKSTYICRHAVLFYMSMCWDKLCRQDNKSMAGLCHCKYHIRKFTCILEYCPYTCFPLVCESVWWFWRQRMLYMWRNRENKIVWTVQIIQLECTYYIAFNILCIIPTFLITFLPDFSPHIAWFAFKLTILLHKLIFVWILNTRKCTNL